MPQSLLLKPRWLQIVQFIFFNEKKHIQCVPAVKYLTLTLICENWSQSVFHCVHIYRLQFFLAFYQRAKTRRIAHSMCSINSSKGFNMAAKMGPIINKDMWQENRIMLRCSLKFNTFWSNHFSYTKQTHQKQKREWTVSRKLNLQRMFVGQMIANTHLNVKIW